MKVILSFIAFGSLAILVPLMISSMVPEENIAERQILQGADPTQVLKHTASGKSIRSTTCDSDRYQYGKSKNGYLYIRDINSDVLASLVDEKLLFFKAEKRAGTAVLNVAVGDPRLELFGAALDHCKRADQMPVSTDLVLNLDSAARRSKKTD